ncbi:hypothetical protein WAF17_18050 [Bernardetia sp. ABR2-2B]|uniref:hypothetical protein n=1 Tax=Bernardetia sp. ABR2-2B TaxID=3127472 RepID=UPI0030D0D5CD
MKILLIWAVITGATYLVSAIASEVKQWATRRALRHVSPKEIAQLIKDNEGKITAQELHQRTAIPYWVAQLVLTELTEQKLLEEKYEKNRFGRRVKQFELSVFPTEQNLRFQLQGIASTTPLKAKEELLDADVIRHAVDAHGSITATRLCLKTNVTIEEAAKKLDQLHTKGVFDIQTSDEGGLFYALNDKSLLS